MARIKITDLPANLKVTRQELRRVRGGAYKLYMPLRGSAFPMKLAPYADSRLSIMYPKVE